MKQFTDNSGKEWSIDIHALSIDQVRREVDVDLIAWATGTGEEVAKAASDPVTIIRVMCSLCADQMEKDGVDEVAFAKALRGDGLENAVEALVEDLIDFFPKSKATLLRSMHDKSRAAEAGLLTRMQAEIDTGVIGKAIDQQLTQFEKTCSTAAALLDSENQEPEPTEH